MPDKTISRRDFGKLGVGLLGALTLGTRARPGRAATPDNLLRVRLAGDIASLDPARVFQIESQTVATNLFSGLVRYDDASGDIKPDLAERWETSADGRATTFYLRDGVKWHRGYGAFSADDVKFSIERIQDPATASSYRLQLDGLKVDVVSPLVVRISRDQADPRMLQVLTAYNQGWLVSRKALQALGAQAHALKPIGTGPFVFENWTPGSEVRLTANPDYFGGKPKLDGVSFRIIKDENAAAAALSSGEIDVFFSLQAPTIIDKLKATPNLVISERAAAYTMNLVLNTSHPPFDDINVRHAVGYAVNRDALIKGYFRNTKTAAFSVLTPAFPEFTTDVPQYAYDPDKARALLKQARASALAIDLVAPAITPYQEVVVPIASDLNAAGFTAKIVLLERGAYAAARAKGTIMTTITGVAGPANADNPLTTLYAKRSFPPGLNTAHYTGAEDLFARLSTERDEKVRMQLYHDLQRRTMADLPVLPLYTMSVFAACPHRVTGMVQNAMGTLNCFSIALKSA